MNMDHFSGYSHLKKPPFKGIITTLAILKGAPSVTGLSIGTLPKAAGFNPGGPTFVAQAAEAAVSGGCWLWMVS